MNALTRLTGLLMFCAMAIPTVAYGQNDADIIAEIRDRLKPGLRITVSPSMEAFKSRKRSGLTVVYNNKNRVIALSINRRLNLESFELFAKLTKLQFLETPRGGTLKNVEGIENLGDLRVLDLGENQLKKLDGIQSLKNLTHLDLNNSWHLVPENGVTYYRRLLSVAGIGKLTNLKELYLQKNHIKDLSELENLTNLEVLNLQYNKPDSSWDVLLNLKKLTWLNLSSTNIRDLTVLRNARNLRSLFLIGNRIKSDQGLQFLSQLEELDISAKRLKTINNILQLQNLRTFAITANRLQGFEGFSRLKNLETLHVTGAFKVTSLSGLDALPKLKTLKLSQLSFKGLPDLGELPALERLAIYGSNITSFAPLSHLKKLKYLTIGANRIPLDPIRGLDALTRLEYLNLRNNKIKRIQGLDKLVRLKELDLSQNQIKKIEGLDQLKNLEELDLMENPVDSREGLPNNPKLSVWGAN